MNGCPWGFFAAALWFKTYLQALKDKRLKSESSHLFDYRNLTAGACPGNADEAFMQAPAPTMIEIDLCHQKKLSRSHGLIV